jgi:hypothetical protein
LVVHFAPVEAQAITLPWATISVAYNLSILGEKSMAMKLVKKTDDHTILQRSDNRYAVKDAKKNAVNGDEKVRILLEEGLIKASVAAAPAAVAEEAPAEEVAEEAPAEDAPAAEEETE